MKFAYYPGCTLKNFAANLEKTAKAVTQELGIEMEELPKWNCCGTVFSQADDDLVHQIAPLRVLINAQKTGTKKLLVVCSMCYNTLKQASLLFKNRPDKLKTLNLFLDDEDDYLGEVEVVHLMEILRDVVGIEKIAKRVKKPLVGLRIAPYYGCLLLRPAEIAIDEPENPIIMEEILAALGAEIVVDPLRVECCGSYQTVNNKEIIADRTYTIVNSARSRGADLIALDCPLCDFNLDRRQKESEKKYTDFFPMPILYYTQLIALAFGIDGDIYSFDKHYADPRPLLRKHQLI